MKLVDILARDLKEWPDSLPHALLTQSVSRSVNYVVNNKLKWAMPTSPELADDWSTAIVDKSDWQSAVETRSLILNCQEVGRITREIPEWTGEGIAPVGANVESKDFGGVTVLAHGVVRGQTVIICQGEDTVITCTPDQLTPFRTPGQIAAEERQSAIEELGNYLISNSRAPTPYLWEVAQKIYDAGYRKFEIVDEPVKEQFCGDIGYRCSNMSCDKCGS